MVTVQVAATDAVSSALLRQIRTLLDEVFPGEFSDHDWEHTIGGVHVWVSDSTGVISHAALVDRVLVCSGETLRVGYVEAVATAAHHRQKGYGSSVMRSIGELIRERYPLGALSTGSYGFYERLGWERWRGLTYVDGPRGRERTPDDDETVMILRTPRSPRLDVAGEIVCDWRAGDVW